MFSFHLTAQHCVKIMSWSDSDQTINPKWKWPGKHSMMFKELGHPDRPGPKQRQTFCKLLPHEVSRLMLMKLAPRSQDIWMYWCCKIAQEPERFNGDEVAVDVSQNINRTVPYTDVSHCFTGSAEIVLITSQRVLLGYEQMMIQGLSLQLVPHIGNHSNNLLKSLSGNSYALGSAMAALSTLFVVHAVEPVKKYRMKRKAPADEFVVIVAD